MTNYGLRAPKTASSGGGPGVPEGARAAGRAVTVGYVAAPGPLLEVAPSRRHRPQVPRQGGGGAGEGEGRGGAGRAHAHPV